MSSPAASTVKDLQSDWTIVVAVARNGAIGRDDKLPWHLSSDLRRFKTLTTGHCLLMGRKTFQSLPKVLPNRQTIVLTRSAFTFDHPDVTIVSDIERVSEFVQPHRKVMVVGGAEVYRSTIPLCNQLWITRVLADVEGDTFFPEVDLSQWNCVSSESFPAGERDQWPTEFERWQRR